MSPARPATPPGLRQRVQWVRRHPAVHHRGVVIVILLLTYRSPAWWLLPLTCVFVALTAAQAVIYLLAWDAGLTVNGQSAFI